MNSSLQDSRKGVDSEQRLYRAFWAVTAFGGVLLTIFILILSFLGAEITEKLDVVTAERAFQAGKKFEAQGDTARAIQRYREALAMDFHYGAQRVACGLSLGDLLVQERRYEEAVQAYLRLPEMAFDRAGALTGYVTALQRKGDLEEAERLGEIWLDKAKQEQNPKQLLWAYSALGAICRQQKRLPAALVHYRAAASLDPKSQAAVFVAHILREQGEKEEALRQLDGFLSRAVDGRLREDAVALREQIAFEVRAADSADAVAED